MERDDVVEPVEETSDGGRDTFDPETLRGSKGASEELEDGLHGGDEGVFG